MREVPIAATGVLRTFCEEGWLGLVDFHLAHRLGSLGGEADPQVLLAFALAARELRLGSVCLDLSTASTELKPESEEDDGVADAPAELPWPETTAWVAAVGASLAGVEPIIGAFLAGLALGQLVPEHGVLRSRLEFTGHALFIPFFLLSVGMLVDPMFLLENIGPVLAVAALIMIAKPLIVLLLGLFFSHSAFTMLVIAAGRSQIGEFSFILGQAGLSMGLLETDHYSLILAGALVSITLNPLMFRLIPPMTRLLYRFPRLWRLLDRHGPPPALPEEGLAGHVVIVGYGRVGEQVVAVAQSLGIPHLVIESDVERVDALNRMGTRTLYGDAANSEVLTHAGLTRARLLVSTVPEDATGELVVAAARDLAPGLPIISRTSTEAGVRTLANLGAQVVIHPELEGGLEMVRHTLLQLGFPLREVVEYTDAVRHDHYDIAVNSEEEHRLLYGLLDAANNIEIHWLRLDAGSSLIGRSLAEANVRALTGASVVALIRDKQLHANPKSSTVFQVDDRIGFVGDPQQIAAAIEMVGAMMVEWTNVKETGL